MQRQKFFPLIIHHPVQVQRQEMNSYYTLSYYSTAILALSLAPFVWGLRSRPLLIKFMGGLTFFAVIATYLIGMLRQNGIDYEAYTYAYYQDASDIPDVGFRLLVFLFRSAGLSFQGMMLFVGIFTLFSLRRVAKYFDISFALLLIFYFLHMALIRDFAQLRVGIALAIIYNGLTFRRLSIRLIIYVLASTIHFTSLFFSIPYEYCKFLSQKENKTTQLLLMLIPLTTIFITVNNLEVLSFIDTRISTYIYWDQENYGQAVGNYNVLFVHLLLLIIAFLNRKTWENNSKVQSLFYLQIVGIFIFLLFSKYAIFAFRLSNAALSLYPVLIISVLNFKDHLKHIFCVVYIVVGLLLIVRSGNLEILEGMKFTEESIMIFTH
jgi:hypothetical protein